MASLGATFLKMGGSLKAEGFGDGRPERIHPQASLEAATFKSSRKPNIVLIIADDLGYECLGCYGSESYKTPVLDVLAATGMRFEHCYSQPLCTPSRVKIMTGQYNFRNYVNFGVLDPKQKTFGHLLRNAGYVTCVVGKWQLYGSVNQSAEVRGTGSLPQQVGFDEYCLWQITDRGSRYKDPVMVQNGKTPDGLKGKYGPDVSCDYALDFIERHKIGPFLLYFPMALVHSPFVPTPDSEDWEKPEHKNNAKYFADMVAYMDKIVGRIVSKLDELGLRENTLVLFTGDNGTNKSIKSKTTNGIIQGDKGRTTDAGTRVPLIVNQPGVVPAGKVCGDLVDFSDFLPTFAEAAGMEIPGDMPVDGRSFLPQLRGERGNPREWIFCHYDPRWGNRRKRRFVRDKRWKLYDNGDLYDVPADKLEQKPNPSGPEAIAARKRLQAVLDSIK
ncbi:MAG: sulfatase-like hydrolase/transferase [Sedimentisphaerales bacterium]|nr:sulfatase-like hydrolase/transferase [Sedimentisphaerales bacterium]